MNKEYLMSNYQGVGGFTIALVLMAGLSSFAFHKAGITKFVPVFCIMFGSVWLVTTIMLVSANIEWNGRRKRAIERQQKIMRRAK